MTWLKRCATLLGIGTLAVGSVVAACQHDVPAPANPAHQEVAPMAPPPSMNPAEPVMTPQPAPGGKTIPSQPGVLVDGGVAPLPTPSNPNMQPSPPTSMMRPMHHVSVAQRDDEAEPQSVPVKQDAGIMDGGVSLPPVPDAGPTLVKDAGQPM